MPHPPLPIFSVKGKRLLPIVQGGMGVGVSAHRLAGAVARAGAMGTIASIDLRHHHADLIEQAKHAATRTRSTGSISSRSTARSRPRCRSRPAAGWWR